MASSRLPAYRPASLNTLCQDEALRETTLSVQVEGETYLLEEDTAQPMYRYDVLVGTTDLMKNPYESYKHKEANP